MTYRIALLFTLTLLLSSFCAHAYKPEFTHPRLSEAALSRTQLELDAALLPRLGLKPFAVKETFRGATRLQLLTAGVIAEDQGDRARNHFFDPYFDRAITVPILGVFGEKSPNWSLEDNGDIADQLESYKDARESMYQALAYNAAGIPPDAKAQVRNGYWASTFERLGHVIHHIQDMAQPQHVRNDAHLDEYRLLGLNPFYNPSKYEIYSQEVASSKVEAFANGTGAPVFPGSTDFKTPRDFWKNSAGTGMAEFTNRNFVSQGTNFTMSFFGNVVTSKYPLPLPGAPQDYSIEPLFVASGVAVPAPIKALCSDVGIDCKVTMYPTPLTAKASTLSIYDQDLEPRGVSVSYADGYINPTYSVSRLFALNRFNYDAAHEILIPKAVAYSAGLINYFFRGQMEISPPDEGVYSLVDHFDFSGDGKTATNAATGFKGFKTIKLKLKNTTPNEQMTGGTLVAVFKFRRNNNYTDDLATEPAGDNAVGTYLGGRAANEEIVVSARVKNAAGLTLGASVPVTNIAETFYFEFDQELPINATDVYLQVVYRGVLGSETDAVVVQTVNISEPTYLTYMNDTDYVKLGGSVYTVDQITTPDLLAQIQARQCLNTDGTQLIPGACFGPLPLSYALKWWNPAPGSSGSAQTNATVALPAPKTYHRFAMLTPVDAPAIVDQSGNVDCQPNAALEVPGRQLQIDIEGNPPTNVTKTINVFPGPPATGVRYRGVFGFNYSCVHNGDGSAPGSLDDRATKMSELPAANKKPNQAGGFNFRAPQ